MGYFKQSDFPKMGKLFRTNLINSLSGFKSLNLLATVDSSGIKNLSIISSVVHLGAKPALMGFVMRPTSVVRDSYNNIIATRFFTFNHIHSDIFKKAHQTSAKYPAEASEFEKVGLEPVCKNDFPAPYVAESNIQVGLEFQQEIPIELNGTILIIGAVKEIYFPDACMTEDGFLAIEKAGTITCAGLDAYYSTQKLARLSYAKPEQKVREIL